MIQVANTEHLAGVTVSGDYYDLDQLVDALHEITVNDMSEDINKHDRLYINVSLRVLGVCYDIRHAVQGDRDIVTKDNGISEFHYEVHEKIVPRHNVYYSCNILYPEMILVMMALNDLVKLRMSKLAGSRYKFDAPFDKTVVWDRTISTVRLFQSAFQEAISGVLTKTSFARWRNVINDRAMEMRGIALPFIDYLNIEYLKMKGEVRSSKLSSIAKRLAEYYNDPVNNEYRRAIDEFVLEHNCDESDLRPEGLEYPDHVEW